MPSKSKIGRALELDVALEPLEMEVGNGFILSWPHPFCLPSSNSFSGLGFDS